MHLALLWVIKPIFFQHRGYIVVHDIPQPFLADSFLVAEIAVAYTEASSQGVIVGNNSVEVDDGIYHLIECLIMEALLILLETISQEAWLHLEETETAAQSIVYHSKATVCRVHHAYDVDILRYSKVFTCVRKFDGFATVAILYEHEEFSEYLAQIATVYLVDDEEILLVGVALGFLAEIVEHTRSQHETSIFRWFIPHDEVFVGEILMKLYHIDLLIIFQTEHGVCKAFGGEGLADTRSTLQYDVLLLS